MAGLAIIVRSITMRRLICAFVVRIWHKTHFLMARLICKRASLGWWTYAHIHLTSFGSVLWDTKYRWLSLSQSPGDQTKLFEMSILWDSQSVTSFTFLYHTTKKCGVLCYTLRTVLSVCPSVSASFPDSNLSSFDWFSSNSYRGGMVWDCKWAKFVYKQQNCSAWLM